MLADDGLITLRRSHPQSAERTVELQESVWNAVRQTNERDDQGEDVQNSGTVRPTMVYNAGSLHCHEECIYDTNLEFAEMRMT